MSRGDLEPELDPLRQENARLKKLLRLTTREAEPAAGDQSAGLGYVSLGIPDPRRL